MAAIPFAPVARPEALTDEDVALVESVQRGLHSRGYASGRFVDDGQGFEISERATHQFHRLVARALAAA